jgi:uncharacterized MAPEG superfamily protein
LNNTKHGSAFYPASSGFGRAKAVGVKNSTTPERRRIGTIGIRSRFAYGITRAREGFMAFAAVVLRLVTRSQK